MRRRLFLDLRDLTRLENLHRRLHQPRRHPANPVLRGEHPWERMASLYGTAIFDEDAGLFRMWYLTGPAADGWVRVRGRKALGNITLLGYAASEDGVRWEKPALGQVDFEGSTANNLVEVGRTNCEGFALLHDRRDPDPARRYKGFYWEHGGTDAFREHEGRTIWGEGEGDGMWMSFSPDGLRWTDCGANPVIPLGSDTTQSLVWDEDLQKYAAFGRFGAGGRQMARALSDDAVRFEPPERVFTPDGADEGGTQFYGVPLMRYEGLYLGMVWVYREGVDGRIDTSLAVSRDGASWERVLDRQTFLSLGESGSWEDGMVRVSQNFVVRGDTLYLYYGGVEGPHTGRKFKTVERKHASAIGLATLRRDGFVSLDAGDEAGHFLSKPLEELGPTLRLNARCRAGGWIRAGLADDTGRPLEGYATGRFGGDSTDAALPFPRDTAALKGKEVRLRVDMRQASLFSYWFA